MLKIGRIHLFSLSFFCLNLSFNDIFRLQHGETKMNIEGRIGGDDSLSENGKKVLLALTS